VLTPQKRGYRNLMLTPELQAEFVEEQDGEDIPPYVMAELADAVIPFPAQAQASGAGANQKKGGWRRVS
jgi:hypothetical protein